MRLARFDGGRLGVVIGDEIADITALTGADPAQWPDMNMIRLIRDFEGLRGAIEAALPGLARIPLAQVSLETPVPWPNKIIAYPVNYHAHGREMQAQYRATNQGFFLKPGSALSGPTDPVVLPAVPGREVHHESELAIIIGKTCRSVAREDWKDVVFGYACLLDMVVRGREERVFRKAYDTFCPVGPWITTADAVNDPATLDMKLWVNDDLRQKANTRDLVLDIPGMIATASAVMTLQPGDIIATGTPEGVGPVVDGDRIRIVIDQVGEMAVDVVQGQEGMTEVFAQPYVPPIIKQLEHHHHHH
uniref:maleylpyruvate hydrolase n=1 Tax=Sphingobium sp. (strain NBRC 103272 / SYK-6) TaxID=627192 RepID=UPI0010FFCD79|nr:Chain A, maleylpyruvate hydrolase [Sphingobium sp. SYK-6]6JVV_B Chain B, maleylpyruvate hydrolase [Sphingobium sp. SYK-6]